MSNLKSLLLKHLLAGGLVVLSACVSPPRWVEQGPGRTLNGQSEGIPGNPVSGAINAIALDRHHPGTAYVATVNGGVWKSKDVNAASPNWAPLTDLKLPALSINSIAVSPLHSSVIFAGTGSTSSLSSEGSLGFGVLRSTNGGATWHILDAATFNNRRINSIVPTSITTGGLAGQVVLAATLFDRGGVYRSTNGGASFTRISGTDGLPDSGASNLVADPTNNTRFYVGVPAGAFGAGVGAGVYRSDNGGVNWTLVNTGLTGLATSQRILLSVGHNTGVVFAMVLNTSGTLTGVFRSANAGATWTAMGQPAPNIFPGGQSGIHGAIAADPVDPNIVYIAGDRQASPFPNVNGCSDFSANMFRGDASLASPWQNIVCNGAQGTSPHADSRSFVFDGNGNLLHTNDGGIYRLENPGATTRRWVTLNTDIRPTEVHSAAYDAVSKVVFGGAQDTGTVMQNATGTRTFTDFLKGDGGVVAVDDTSTGGTASTRYTSFFNLGFFNRSVWNAANTLISGPTPLGLLIVSGPGTGQTLFQFDTNIQFYNPYELNRIDPTRMLIGTANIYESFDRGDRLNNLIFTGRFISSLSYGGRLNGVNNPDAFYVGTHFGGPPFIFHRATAGGPINVLTAYPGGSVVDLVMDPQNTEHVYVTDQQGRVWASLDAGVTWNNLTLNLPNLIFQGQTRTIEVFSPDAFGRHTVLLVGGLGGVFQLRHPDRASTVWTRVGRNLPHGLVFDLRYNYKDNVLTAGILGRGIWTLTNFFSRGERFWKSEGVEKMNDTATDEAMDNEMEAHEATTNESSTPIALPADMPTAPSQLHRSEEKVPVQPVRAVK